jgi:hypothetical protein
VNRAAYISAERLPSATVAAEWYYTDLGTRLNPQAVFGRDPFDSENQRRLCEMHFRQAVPDLGAVLSSLLHRDFRPFQLALNTLLNEVRRYS